MPLIELMVELTNDSALYNYNAVGPKGPATDLVSSEWGGVPVIPQRFKGSAVSLGSAAASPPRVKRATSPRV